MNEFEFDRITSKHAILKSTLMTAAISFILIIRTVEELKTKIPNTEQYIEETGQQIEEMTQAEQELGGKVSLAQDDTVVVNRGTNNTLSC